MRRGGGGGGKREREVGHRKARSLREPVSPPSPLVGIYGQPRSSRSSRWIFSNINKRAPAKCSTVIYRLFRALLAAYITRCLRVRASMLSCNRPSKEETFRVLTSTRASRTPIFNRAGGKIGPMIGPGLGDGVYPADWGWTSRSSHYLGPIFFDPNFKIFNIYLGIGWCRRVYFRAT